jgi:hypothetical protein
MTSHSILVSANAQTYVVYVVGSGHTVISEVRSDDQLRMVKLGQHDNDVGEGSRL